MTDDGRALRWLEDGFAVAGQINADEFTALKAAGIGTIINNRPDGEEHSQPTNQELATAAAAAGIGWRHAPMAGGIAPTMLDAVDEATGGQGAVLAFCRSGTRSTYLWALARARAGEDLDVIAARAAAAGYDLAAVRPLMERLSAEAN